MTTRLAERASSETYIGVGNNTFDLFTKLKLTCGTHGESQTDKWKLNRKRSIG